MAGKKSKSGFASTYSALLLKGLDLIANDPRTNASAYDMADACRTAVNRLRQEKGGRELSAPFSLSFPIDLQDPKVQSVSSEPSAQVVIGAQLCRTEGSLIEQTVEMVLLLHPDANRTRSDLGCCFTSDRNDGEWIVVRRFHYDVTTTSVNGPKAHLQYGGNLSTIDAHYCLDKRLETPRLPVAPMDLLLVIDLVLRQFGTPIAHLPGEADWRGVIAASESLWQVPYYKQAATAAQSAVANRTLYEQVAELPAWEVK